MIELIPVVEFEPISYAQEGRSSPSVTGDKAPEAWLRYWYESLADSGITELKAVDYSWFVRVTDITRPETIAKMLHVIMPDQAIKTRDDLEFIGAINGGYVLRTNDYSIFPTCCVSLADITSWETASVWQKPEWQDVWIGHPWIYCRYNGSHLEFTQHTESSEGLEAAFSVQPDDLQTAVEAARTIVVDFGIRLRPEVEKIVPHDLVDPALDILLWGKYPF